MVLISTTHHVLLFDPATHAFARVHTGQGLYFGLGHAEGRTYIACRNQTKGPENEEVRRHEAGSVLVLDEQLRVVEEIVAPFPLRDLHALTVFDGRLWCCCSFDNMIAICDLSTREWEQWYPAADPYARGRDIHHFNTIERWADGLYLVAHNFGPSHILRFSYPDRQLISATELGNSAHDLFRFRPGGALATCDSAHGCLVSADGTILRTGGFPRGVCAEANSLFLGISQWAPRAQRDQMHGILRRFTPDWQQTADYLLGPVGMVLALLPIEMPPTVWDRLPGWTEARAFLGAFNTEEPGNRYRPATLPVVVPEWHAPDAEMRWTAARQARLRLILNPGESRVRLNLISYAPAPFTVEFMWDGQAIGKESFAAGPQSSVELAVPAQPGRHELALVTPRLWQPAAVYAGSTDERWLGVAVSALEIG